MKRLFFNLAGKLQRNTNSLRYIPLVDGIRFLAIALVIIQHLNERVLKFGVEPSSLGGMETSISYLFSRGSIGVLIFFVLSGFIIALPFANGRAFFKSFDFKSFYLRRLTRLEPPYIIWMSVFFMVLIVQQGRVVELVPHYIASIFYVHNIIYADFSIINPVAWSLEVEIQFYLLSPVISLLYFAVNKANLRRIVLGVIIIAFMSVQHMVGWQQLPFKASLLGHLQHFLTGILLADLYASRQHLQVLRKSLYDILFFVSLTIMAFTWSEEFVKSLVFQVAIFILFISIYKGKLVSNLLSLRWITIFGGMCYTIYLIHLPLFEGMSTVLFNYLPNLKYPIALFIFSLIVIPVMVIISIVGYLLIEKPFMSGSISLSASSGLKSLLGYIRITRTTLARMFFLVVGLLVSVTLAAQPEKTKPPLKVEDILTLDEIMTLSDQNSMMSASYESEKRQVEEEIKVLKKDWMDNIFLTSNLNYGNGYYSDEIYNNTVSSQSFLSRQRSTVNVGVNIYLPLSRVTSKHNQVNMRRHQIESLEYKRKSELDEQHRTILKHYKDLLFNIKALTIYSEKVEVNSASYELAKRYFKAGQVEMTEYQSTVDAFFAAQVEYEKALNETYYSLRVLEDYVGMSIIRK